VSQLIYSIAEAGFVKLVVLVRPAAELRIKRMNRNERAAR
jgi:hypothetical protein